MRIISSGIIAIVVLLSIAAGAAKVMQVPQEMEFLQGAGLSTTLIIVFGLVQVSGGVLLVARKTRMIGAILAASAFAVSTILIFLDGNPAFGALSAIPIALAAVILLQEVRAAHE